MGSSSHFEDVLNFLSTPAALEAEKDAQAVITTITDNTQ